MEDRGIKRKWRALRVSLLGLLGGCCLLTAITTQAAGTAPTDAELTRRVEQALADSAVLDGAEIQVETQDAVVHLTGTAQNSDQASEARLIAAGVSRVKDVRNDIHIRLSMD